MSLRKLMSLRDKVSRSVLLTAPGLLSEIEDSLEYAEEKIIELDNFVDFLIDKFDVDREELMNQFKEECEDED